MQAATVAGLTSMAPAAAIRADTSETNSNVTVQPNPSFPEDLNTSDILVETLIDWGATHVFGVVGDGINSIIEALRKRRDRVRYVGVRHEEAAAFMACGLAKNTGTSRRVRWHDGPGRHPFDERPL